MSNNRKITTYFTPIKFKTHFMPKSQPKTKLMLQLASIPPDDVN